MSPRFGKILSAIALSTVLSGCVTDDGAGRRAATEAYGDCAIAAVKRLDDGKSDPASIGMGVAGACSGQYAQLSNRMVDEMNTENAQAYMRDQMRTNELRMATNAVLTFRAAKRQ